MENLFCYNNLRADREGKRRTRPERYRSGHNEAVLKTVCPQGRVGSNPTLSADDPLQPNLLARDDLRQRFCGGGC